MVCGPIHPQNVACCVAEPLDWEHPSCLMSIVETSNELYWIARDLVHSHNALTYDSARAAGLYE